MMIRHLTVLAALGLLLGATPLAAQHQHGGGAGQGTMMGQGQEMMPGMAIRAFAPDQLLAKRDTLGLTDDQVKQLEQLQADAKRDHDQAMASHDKYRTQMTQALQADKPDVAVIQGYYAGAHDSMGQAHWAEMRAGLLAMGVLTDAQRAKVKETQPGGGMQHRHGQGGR
jgi:Spy/CpxP family protein refolding chaperone